MTGYGTASTIRSTKPSTAALFTTIGIAMSVPVMYKIRDNQQIHVGLRVNNIPSAFNSITFRLQARIRGGVWVPIHDAIWPLPGATDVQTDG